MIVSRPIGLETNDLLEGQEMSDLLIYEDENLMKRQVAPIGGWTHELLESYPYDNYAPFIWDAYLGDKSHWIGSSEV